MEVFRGECNFSQSSWVKRKGKSSTGGGGTDITGKCNSPIDEIDTNRTEIDDNLLIITRMSVIDF